MRTDDRIERLTAPVEQLAAETAELRAERGRARWGARGRARLGLAGLLVLLVSAFPLAAMAHTGYFGDVPHGAQFHTEINAIAGAGITTGCTATPTYCPDATVDRKAMAAFLSRGLGRVAAVQMPPVTTPPNSVSPISGWSLTLTPGLPANLLSGAACFIEADAAVQVFQSGTGGCLYDAELLIDGIFVVQPSPFEVLVNSNLGNRAMIPVAGARAVTSAGPKTVEVRLWKLPGDCDPVGVIRGNLTAIYAPFGNAGGKTL